MLVLSLMTPSSWQVSACLPDEMLVQEGALRAHNLLSPLLALTAPPPEVHKALVTIHIGLQGVANLVQVQCLSFYFSS